MLSNSLNVECTTYDARTADRISEDANFITRRCVIF